jgi:hypothetical protein
LDGFLMPRITEYGPTRPHLTTGALGYSPGIVTGEVPVAPDFADDAAWYIPYETSSDPGYVQFKRSPLSVAGVATSTLDAAPSPGNKLLAFIPIREATGVTISMSGTDWTLVESAYCGSTTDDWPCYLYERTVQPGDSSAWTATSSALATFALWLVEVEGVSELDASDESSDASTQPTMSLTPVTADPIIILSFVSLRRDVDTAFTPATGMTEIVDDHVATSGSNGPQVAINYQVDLAPTGSYTVGSTWGTGNFRAVIAASFVGSAGDVVYLPAFAVNDGDDATFDYVDVTQLEFLRGTLAVQAVLVRADIRVGLENSGSATIDVEGANESDFSDAVQIGTATFSGTGSYTAQDVAITLDGTDGYTYIRFLLGSAQGIHVHEVELTALSTTGGVTDHPELTGRSDADQHPASSVSFDPTGLANTSATDVQEAIEDLDGAISGGGIPASIVDAKGDLIAATAADTVARLPVISGNGSSLVVASGASTGLAWQLNKYDATTAPTVNEDTGDGYSVGSVWIDVTGDAAYICVDASSGAAVWLPFDSGGGESWEGSWSAGTYTLGQIVEHDDVIYQVNTTSTTDEPPGTDWDVLYTAPSGAVAIALDSIGTSPSFIGFSSAGVTANLIYYYPVVIPTAMTAKKMWYVTGTTATSATALICLGIYDSGGTRLVTTGSTAYNMSASTYTTIDIADTALSAGLHYIAIVVDTVTGVTLMRATLGTASNPSMGMLEQASTFPLPSTETWTMPLNVSNIPLFGLTARSEV